MVSRLWFGLQVLIHASGEGSVVMISTSAAFSGSYDYGEVARSVFIAIAASYAALDLTGRVTVASGRARLAWLSGGAVAMGIGIWAMHIKGMLAFHPACASAVLLAPCPGITISSHAGVSSGPVRRKPPKNGLG